jgi:biotin transport system ATP-binding protein
MITFDGATVTVAGPQAATVQLLAPVTCELTERRVAVIGANGSGKSTLARLVNGLVLPSAGRVLVDDLDTARHGAEVRRRVGFVFTDPDSQLVMPTPVEDIALSLRRLGLSRADREIRAKGVLERIGLGDRADVPVQSLSGGQKQLLALAVVTHDLEAAARADRVLVLDRGAVVFDGAPHAAVDCYLELMGSGTVELRAGATASRDQP